MHLNFTRTQIYLLKPDKSECEQESQGMERLWAEVAWRYYTYKKFAKTLEDIIFHYLYIIFSTFYFVSIEMTKSILLIHT